MSESRNAPSLVFPVPKPRDVRRSVRSEYTVLILAVVMRLNCCVSFSKRKPSSAIRGDAMGRFYGILRPSTFSLGNRCKRRMSGSEAKNTRAPWKILLARPVSPRPTFLIPSDGFLMNLAGHIGFFINSAPRIFNLMIIGILS